MLVRLGNELVRCGAQDAPLLEDGLVSVTVCANSTEAADSFVRELFERVSAKAIALAERDLALV
jgi:hypothetical protein